MRGMSGVGKGVNGGEDRAVFLTFFFVFHADKTVDGVVMEGRRGNKGNTVDTKQ